MVVGGGAQSAGLYAWAEAAQTIAVVVDPGVVRKDVIGSAQTEQDHFRHQLSPKLKIMYCHCTLRYV